MARCFAHAHIIKKKVNRDADQDKHGHLKMSSKFIYLFIRKTMKNRILEVMICFMAPKKDRKIFMTPESSLKNFMAPLKVRKIFMALKNLRKNFMTPTIRTDPLGQV